MNWSNIENRWDAYKSSARQQWGKLSDEQVDGTMGKREQLSSKVQEAYGVAADEAERQISDWQAKQKETQPPAA